MKYILKTHKSIKDNISQCSLWLSAMLMSSLAVTANAADPKQGAAGMLDKIKTNSGYDTVRTDGDLGVGFVENLTSTGITVVVGVATFIGFCLFVFGILKIINLSKQQQPIGPGIIMVIGGLFLMVAGAAGFALSGQLETVFMKK